MTKDVSLSTTAPKARDAAVAAVAPASKAGNDGGEVDSFATLLDTATPAKSDEREEDNSSGHAKVVTERDHSDGRDGGAAYFAPADLALAWLASSDVTPRSPKEAGGDRGTTETPAHSKIGTTTALATDLPDSGDLVAADEVTSRGEDDALRGPQQGGTPLGISEDVTESGTETSSASSATSNEHRRDGRAATYVTGTSSGSGRANTVLWPVSGSRSVPASERLDANSVSSPAQSGTALATSRRATLLASDDAEQPAGPSASSEPSRAREPLGLPGGDTKTISPSSTITMSAMPSPELQAHPGESVGRSSGATVPNASGQSTGGPLATANTELSAAITRAQRAADGSFRVTALLNPPSLGRVDVAIKVNGESVEVAITPHTAEGHDALSRHLDELQRELASEHGEVHLSLSDSGGQARHSDDPRRELTASHLGDEDDAAPVEIHTPPADSSLHLIL
jgi:flagellar hook-length control protein FliK